MGESEQIRRRDYGLTWEPTSDKAEAHFSVSFRARASIVGAPGYCYSLIGLATVQEMRGKKKRAAEIFVEARQAAAEDGLLRMVATCDAALARLQSGGSLDDVVKRWDPFFSSMGTGESSAFWLSNTALDGFRITQHQLRRDEQRVNREVFGANAHDGSQMLVAPRGKVLQRLQAVLRRLDQARVVWEQTENLSAQFTNWVEIARVAAQAWNWQLLLDSMTRAFHLAIRSADTKKALLIAHELAMRAADVPRHQVLEERVPELVAGWLLRLEAPSGLGGKDQIALGAHTFYLLTWIGSSSTSKDRIMGFLDAAEAGARALPDDRLIGNVLARRATILGNQSDYRKAAKEYGRAAKLLRRCQAPELAEVEQSMQMLRLLVSATAAR